MFADEPMWKPVSIFADEPMWKRQRTMSLRESFVHMESNYNDNSALQASANVLITSWVQECAAATCRSLPAGTPLRVMEFGPATGGSSIKPIEAITASAGEMARPVEVTMNDLPRNDWATLRKTVETAFPDVQFNFSRASMYKECIAEEGTQHLGYSVYAQQWLDKGAPCGLDSSALWANQIQVGDPARSQWADASKRDWVRFLELRAREIAKGGHFVLVISGSNPDGSLEECLAATMLKAKAELASEGVLTEEEVPRFNVPEYHKSAIEVLEPLACEELKQVWKVCDFKFCTMKCPYMEKLENGDAFEADIVEEALSFLKAFCNPSLLEGVRGDTAKLDKFWERVVKIAGGRVQGLASNFRTIFLRLERV